MGSVFAKPPHRTRTRQFYKPPKPNSQGAVAIGIKHPKRAEENIQLKVCRYLNNRYPAVIYISDNAAGADLSDTARRNMMSMRSDEGMPDISIDEPSRGYHGLRLELKKDGTKIYKKDGKTLRKQSYTRKYKKNGRTFIKRGDHLQEQADMIKKYRDKGYWACFAVGYEDACNKIDRYLDRQQTLGVF